MKSEQQNVAGRQKLEKELKRSEETYHTAQAELQVRQRDELKQADAKYLPLLAERMARRDGRLEEAKQRYSRQLEEINQRAESESDRLLTDHFRETVEGQQQFDRQWGTVVEHWRSGMEEFQTATAGINAACQQLFPAWHAVDWNAWKPAAEIPPAVPIGQFPVRLCEIDGGIPADPQLRPKQTDFTLPALFPFRDRSLILLKATGEDVPGLSRRSRPSCSACSPRCRRARCGLRSSIPSDWARTSRPSCTWPTTTTSS